MTEKVTGKMRLTDTHKPPGGPQQGPGARPLSRLQTRERQTTAKAEEINPSAAPARKRA